MRKFYGIALLLAAFGFASAASSTQAQDGWDLGDNLFGEESAVDVGGWTQWGYTSETTGLFNSNPDRINNNQSWIYLEKVADGSDGFDLGGRVDFMYGTDSGDTQAFGNDPGNWDFMNGWDRGAGYGFAMPQLYAEVAAGDLSVKLGHFYTLLGYEVVTAPDNFFYSHAFTMYNSEAFTHTGALASYAVGDNTTIYAGWTAGWDTGFDQFGGGSSFLGGFSTGLGDNVTFTYITTFGDFGAIGEGYSHSIVIDFALSDNLNYVFQSDVLNTNQGNGIFDPMGTTFDTIGINQYLFYTINDEVAVGGRMEWWKAASHSVYQMTAGVNFKPTPNLIIRPEIRYQWSPYFDQFQVANDNYSLGEAIFGIDAILTF
jgi:hypothetical protein